MNAVNLIWAQARNGAIGKDNALPWRLPEDLAHFKLHTLNQVVLMGRKTWDSLPRKPLPSRDNIVISRQVGLQLEGAQVFSDLAEAIAAQSKPVWVIGGAQLYHAALPLAQRLLVTHIELDVADADAFAPVIDGSWQGSRSALHSSSTGLQYYFADYRRLGAA